MFPLFFDSTMLLLIPAVLFSLWAQFKVKSAYAKYAEVGTRSGISGAEVAERILLDENVQTWAGVASNRPQEAMGVAIESIGGELSDHYDPRDRTLRLSENVYYGRSIASLGIAAHEVGHAIQHARAYGPLMLRNVVYPACNIGSTLAWPLFFIGLLFSFPMLLKAGVLLFGFAVFFTVLTLPVEFDASRRALRALAGGGYLSEDELHGARKVLTAAALTYVAAAVMAILQLIRMLLLSQSQDRD